jgi:hypothetical protein
MPYACCVCLSATALTRASVEWSAAGTWRCSFFRAPGVFTTPVGNAAVACSQQVARSMPWVHYAEGLSD